MHFPLTEAAGRAVLRATAWCDTSSRPELIVPRLLWELAAEPECRAARALAQGGVGTAEVGTRWPELNANSVELPHVGAPPNLNASRGGHAFDSPGCHAEAALSRVLDHAQLLFSDLPRPRELATEHLLASLAGLSGEVASWLADCGFRADELCREILRRDGIDDHPLDVEDTWADEPHARETSTAPQRNSAPTRIDPAPDHLASMVQAGVNPGVWRVLDASANRAMEGLRVVEDFLRFVAGDAHLTRFAKSLRHELRAALALLPADWRLAMRDVPGDVGTAISTPGEAHRATALDVALANWHRLEESLRSLEEFSKIVSNEAAAQFEQLRYRAYTLHRAGRLAAAPDTALLNARLYVLVGGALAHDALEQIVSALVEAEVDLIQLRDKDLDDAQRLARGQCVRALTRGTHTRFIMNDRPDLAGLAEADGVHLGQDDLGVAQARAIVGPAMWVGVSTHSIEQARQAVLDGASYIGVGPVFPSPTKSFGHYPGLALVQAVAAEITLPAFAIGGIDRANVDAVMEAGLSRVAVGSAIVDAGDPAAAAREFQRRLNTG